MTTLNPFKAALKSYRTILVATITFSVAINMLMFVSPLYMLQVYDRVLQSRSETTLVMITFIALAMLAVYAMLEWVRSRVLVRAGLRFDEMIAKGLFNRVVTSTIRQPGGKSEFVLGDVDRLREFLTGSGLIAICDVPWVPVFILFCFLFHPMVGYVALAGAIIVFALALLNEIMTKKTLNEASGLGQSAQHFATTTLQNIEAIRALGMENSLRSRWHDMHRGMLEKQAVASDHAGAIQSFSKFIRMGLQVLILGVGAYLVLQGEISPGSMIACSILMGRALQPVDQVVGQWKQVVGARQAYGRLSQLFTQVPGEEEKTQLPNPSGRISIANLAVVPPGSRTPLLQGVSFEAIPGEAVALVGPSGAGKSSLMRALVGIWPAAAGSIRLDGAELQHWEPDMLGKHLGYLPQSVELFNGTVAENISRFQEGARDQDVLVAAQQARVHQMIQNLPDGYNTQIGVGGRSLSGGQRQRVGLARALYGDPALIILDEPNANLDSEGEEALFQIIQELKARGKTILFVSHKMSLVSLAEKSLILADGRMRSFGPTQELLKIKPAPKAVQAPAVPAAVPQTRSIA
ncbi:type I secretion system permease/ATPase [Devosia sp. RR2S18]|uniref:type I secretion system permease/ATPase n=1 Tax=Devosia rhizosphaerae TaxID=3049774 RepID=UPI0025408530|nr:type I secretion system permease/ATPase [Devosia sp. RR2S18]WIJ24042.1 type I secretion system permease/ATPase [Devosia sp. RR2S18]